jgi:tetratricopeptide (TPR) repeat protein
MVILRSRRWLSIYGIGLLVAGCTSIDDKAAEQATAAGTAFQQGNLPAARIYINRAIDLRDDVSEYWLLLARVQARLGENAGAYKAYRNVLVMDRSNLEALAALSQLGVTLGKAEEVEEFADKLLLVNPDDPVPLITKGHAALARGDRKAALGFAERVLQQAPGNGGALVLKAQVLMHAGKLAAAAQLLEASMTPQGDGRSRLIALLEIYRRLADVAAYRRTLVRLAQDDQKDSRVQLQLASLLYDSGDIRAASALTHTLLQRHSQDQTLALALLELWLETGPSALGGNEQSELKKSGSPIARAVAASFLASTGEPRAARAILGPDVAAMPYDGSSLAVHAAFAQALAAQGRSANARSVFDRVLRIDSHNPLALAGRAQLKLAEGDSFGALSDARVLVADDPRSVSSRLLLVEVLSARHEQELAESALREGIDARPDATRLASALAARLLARNAVGEAGLVLRNLRDADPIGHRARALRAKLCPTIGPSCGDDTPRPTALPLG